MKIYKLMLLLVVWVGYLGIQQTIGQVSYHADPDQSTIIWVGKKVGGEHSGTISLKKGVLNMNGEDVSDGHFEIDMNSITNTDIEKPNSNIKLVNHLKSEDFFFVEKYPASHFSLKDTKRGEGDKVHFAGDLTIKGITHPIEFEAIMVVSDGHLHVKAKIVVDRAKFNVRYGSGSFFSNLGNRMIYDDFDLDVDIFMKKK